MPMSKYGLSAFAFWLQSLASEVLGLINLLALHSVLLSSRSILAYLARRPFHLHMTWESNSSAFVTLFLPKRVSHSDMQNNFHIYFNGFTCKNIWTAVHCTVILKVLYFQALVRLATLRISKCTRLKCRAVKRAKRVNSHTKSGKNRTF
jgi:hypothetical protein